jgi:carboxylesterase
MLGTIILAIALGAIGWRVTARARIERRTAARLPVGADGIIRGAAPIDLRDGARGVGVLLLHGFADTPQTFGYLAPALHARGWSVHAPLLPGHGRTLEAFAMSGEAQWLDAAREALRDMCARHERVALVGLSMGGELAAVLAAETPALRALVLLAPYLELSPVVRAVSGMPRAAALVAPYLSRGSMRSIHDPEERGRALGYGATPPHALAELGALVARAREALPRITAPTLYVQSRGDNRLAPAVAERAFAAIGAREKRLEWLERSGHVITVDYERDRVIDAVGDWIAAQLAR